MVYRGCEGSSYDTCHATKELQSSTPLSQPQLYSTISFTHFHSPFRVSFHSVTLLSPPETARTFPLKLQLTLQSTASKLNNVLFHSLGRAGSDVQILTVLSCEAEAMYDFRRIVGAHATSRTQSAWPAKSRAGR